MDLAAFLLATAVAHVGFAIFVAAHARLTDQSAGNWPYITLALGLAGIAGYFFYDGSDGAI
ncbi:uncharacterized protein Nmag_1505 [Natrialba magadii ATCC 43099]|uniref:Uncharacterized protein n=1 Tax=Natrialba magadii (strain ATCC 43099 / DSM 3394 / CCM 3739 / CIP 104546 / IAM 13178 / JCM 8861 / NBRC 102185 / NCIMB 2190 / MS3) TaxID=547559 RepID=D3STR4_NATMM|nr:hypothetical protein [Natrialba magadii]ADD05081.1 uncharacterized protein Nmag_1505 [Natrialba magadii ATCC 43099]ELY23316.1 hypothetical protein C500_20051 [Natrialba magadii ATCC 43099]